MGGLIGGGNAILLLLTAMAVAGAVLIALISSRRKGPSVAPTFLGGAAIITVLYCGSVLAASAASTETVLARGETKWFCGFYLDCHLGISVDHVEKTQTIAGREGPVKAAGNFYIVTLDLHNSARNPGVDMLLYRPQAEVVDASGNRYTRSAPAEAAIAGSQRAPVLGDETRVAHDSLSATIAFDLPANVSSPRLMISEGWIVDKVIELGLIDDENSIFHKGTWLALDAGGRRTAAR